jgi:hypothetical protein
MNDDERFTVERDAIARLAREVTQAEANAALGWGHEIEEESE